MNHHEPASVVSRLYYIKDRAAAIKWDGTNYFYDFEAMDDMKAAGFPLKGNVEPYSEFVANHRQFLIFAIHMNGCRCGYRRTAPNSR